MKQSTKAMHNNKPMFSRLAAWSGFGLLCCLGQFAAAGSAEDWKKMKAIIPKGYGQQIQKALNDAPADQRDAMQFLVVNMPAHDLRELSADFLLENVRLAYQAWNETPWKNAVPQNIFFNDVLPYASISERRDPGARISTSNSARW